MTDLVALVVVAAVSLVPFAALVHVRASRRRRALAAWERENALRASGAEIVRVRVALAPDDSHTIWIQDIERHGPETILPPLCDARGRPVVLEPGKVTFTPDALEIRCTRSERGEFGDNLVLEQVVRVAGSSELYLRARPVDRGADLLLAPIEGAFLVQTSEAGFPPIPAPRPRPVVVLHLGAYGVLALATTLLPVALGVFLGRVVETTWATMVCPVLVVVVFVVVARAADIERRVERVLSRDDSARE